MVPVCLSSGASLRRGRDARCSRERSRCSQTSTPTGHTSRERARTLSLPLKKIGTLEAETRVAAPRASFLVASVARTSEARQTEDQDTHHASGLPRPKRATGHIWFVAAV